MSPDNRGSERVNEQLETENRKLKVAAIGMMAQPLRGYRAPGGSVRSNISGMGLWTGGDDAGTEDKERQGATQAGPKAKKPANDGGGTETERRWVSRRAPRRLRVTRNLTSASEPRVSRLWR